MKKKPVHKKPELSPEALEILALAFSPQSTMMINISAIPAVLEIRQWISAQWAKPVS